MLIIRHFQILTISVKNVLADMVQWCASKVSVLLLHVITLFKDHVVQNVVTVSFKDIYLLMDKKLCTLLILARFAIVFQALCSALPKNVHSNKGVVILSNVSVVLCVLTVCMEE